jgi:hypothetical protein
MMKLKNKMGQRKKKERKSTKLHYICIYLRPIQFIPKDSEYITLT